MALERKWLAIAAKPLTSDGTSLGVVTVQDTAGYRTKMKVGLKSNTQQPAQFQVQEVISSTQMVLGLPGPKVGRDNFADISRFTVADSATVHAAEQDKNHIPDKDHYPAVYEGDPVIADRVLPVDQYGRTITESNPLPVDTIRILDPYIRNIEVPNANTEMNFAFPANTKKFLIRVRDGQAKMQISWIEGDTSTTFITVGMGCNYSEEINVSDKKICFQLSKPNKIIELLYWVQPAS